MMSKFSLRIFALAAIIASCTTDLLAQSGLQVLRSSGLRRGVNFGNMLEAPEAPVEGQWGFTVQEIFFDKVVEAGLDHIRLPVSWTNHASLQPPYKIDPAFMSRVDWAVRQATNRRLLMTTQRYGISS
jgi:endoglucanase